MSSSNRSSGIFGGVLNFVSREIESFVANATGQPIPAPEVYSDDDLDDTEEHEDSREIYDEPDNWELPPRKRTKTSHQREPRKAQLAPSLSDDDDDQRNASPSPPPPPRALKRRQSMTMPGSLFPRSPSIEPDSIPDREQRVRFSSKALCSPAVPFSPHRRRSTSSTRPPQPSPTRPSTPSRKRTDSNSSSSKVRAAVDKFRVTPADADPSILLPNPNRSPQSPQHSKKDKGKGRAIDPPLTPERVRGKEKELAAARQQFDRNERQIEQNAHIPLDTSTLTNIDRDRERDKARIRMLEEEIERLKQELLRRPSDSFAIPPPPPPAPPPPPPGFTLPKKTLLEMSGVPTSDPTNTLFSSARALLNRAPAPIEKPINPLTSSTRRAGMPTVGIVAPDKMAAFLNEMKTVRLRKVAKADSVSTIREPSRERSVGVSLRRSLSVSGRSDMAGPSSQAGNYTMNDIDTQIGQKRKRALGTADDVPVPFRRRSEVSSSGPSSSSPAIPPPPSSSAMSLSSRRNWETQNSSVTPSLCSDNGRDETTPEDMPPSTPQSPPVSASDISTAGPSRALFRFKGNGVPVQDDARAEPKRRGLKLRDRSTSEVGNDTRELPVKPPSTLFRPSSTVFDKRPPSTPIPDKSPRRPKPPSSRNSQRTASGARQRVVSREEGDDEDPLSLSFSSPEAPFAPSATSSNRKSASTAGSTPHPAATERPRSRSRSRSQSHSSFRTNRQRRITLDEEIRNATSSSSPPRNDVEEEDEDPHDLYANDRDEHDNEDESGMYTAVGTRSKKRGFLAHGGAGGPAVFMGVGYVEGAMDSDQEEVEQMDKRGRRMSVSRSAADDDEEYLPAREREKSRRGRARR